MTETSRSLLDVILVNNDHRITDSAVVPVPLSDHYLVYCILKAGVIKAPPKTIGQFGKYHNTLCLCPQILHKHCFCFLFGPL